jgi:hypothetical protein
LRISGRHRFVFLIDKQILHAWKLAERAGEYHTTMVKLSRKDD